MLVTSRSVPEIRSALRMHEVTYCNINKYYSIYRIPHDHKQIDPQREKEKTINTKTKKSSDSTNSMYENRTETRPVFYLIGRCIGLRPLPLARMCYLIIFRFLIGAAPKHDSKLFLKIFISLVLQIV